MTKAGVISEHEMYTAEELKARGIGRETLSKARRSGIVTAAPLGKRHFYLGRELIAYGLHLRSNEHSSSK
jgi:hypothetical protein